MINYKKQYRYNQLLLIYYSDLPKHWIVCYFMFNYRYMTSGKRFNYRYLTSGQRFNYRYMTSGQRFNYRYMTSGQRFNYRYLTSGQRFNYRYMTSGQRFNYRYMTSRQRFNYATWRYAYVWTCKLCNLCKKTTFVIKRDKQKITKTKFKQWWTTIPPISTKQTITSHINWTHCTQKKTYHMPLEIQILH